MKLEFHPEAERELVAAAEHYEQQLRGLGGRFEAEVRHALEHLTEYPELGASVDGDLRKLPLMRFPFTLYYSVTEDSLRVEVVAHHRRRPGYWETRLGRERPE